MNLRLINKNDGKDYHVYDITYDKSGYPHFLIYKDGEWVRMSAKHFRPYSGYDFGQMLKEYSKTGVMTFPVL